MLLFILKKTILPLSHKYDLSSTAGGGFILVVSADTPRHVSAKALIISFGGEPAFLLSSIFPVLL